MHGYEAGSALTFGHRMYRFGSFCLRSDGTLLRNSEVVTLPPKELAVLRGLLAVGGQIASPDYLRKAGWGQTHVSSDSLPRCISSLRARLEPENCISTIYKRGYRFNLPIAVASGSNREGATGFEAESRVAQPHRNAASATLGPVFRAEPVPPTPIRVHADSALRTDSGSYGGVVPRIDDSSAAGSDWHTRPTGLPRLLLCPFSTGLDIPEALGIDVIEETMLQLSEAGPAVVDVLESTSATSVAGRGLSNLEVGRTLGANLVLCGKITAQPLHFRLRAELFQVSDGVQLWVEDFLVSRELQSAADAYMAQRVCAQIARTFFKIPSMDAGLESHVAVSHASPAGRPSENKSLAFLKDSEIRNGLTKNAPNQRGETYSGYLRRISSGSSSQATELMPDDLSVA